MTQRSKLDANEIRLFIEGHLRESYKPPYAQATYDWFVNYSIPQSLIFYTDIIPYLHHVLARLQWGSTVSILDAGCGSESGADYIARLHKSIMLGHYYNVVGVDRLAEYKAFADIAYPDITFSAEDVFNIKPSSYDVVLCSHVIEHFEDATEFMNQLISIGRLCTIFYCPFQEKNRLSGHLRSIDRAFVSKFNPAFVEVRGSLGWRHPADDVSECVLFIVPGPDWASLEVPPYIAWTQDEPPPRLRTWIGQPNVK